MNNQRGQPTYLKISELATEYHRSRQTIYKDLEAIEQDDRYKGFWIYLHDGQPKMINRNVYEDFLHWKTWLSDINLRKHLKPYDPDEVSRQRGSSQLLEDKQEQPDINIMLADVLTQMAEKLKAERKIRGKQNYEKNDYRIC